jgi:hypothetical protein
MVPGDYVRREGEVAADSKDSWLGRLAYCTQAATKSDVEKVSDKVFLQRFKPEYRLKPMSLEALESYWNAQVFSYLAPPCPPFAGFREMIVPLSARDDLTTTAVPLRPKFVGLSGGEDGVVLHPPPLKMHKPVRISPVFGPERPTLEEWVRSLPEPPARFPRITGNPIMDLAFAGRFFTEHADRFLKEHPYLHSLLRYGETLTKVGLSSAVASVASSLVHSVMSSDPTRLERRPLLISGMNTVEQLFSLEEQLQNYPPHDVRVTGDGVFVTDFANRE